MQEHSNTLRSPSQTTVDRLSPRELRFATSLIDEIKRWKAEKSQQEAGMQ